MKINKELKKYLILLRRTNMLGLSILLGIFTMWPVATSFDMFYIYMFIVVISCIYYSTLNIISDKTLSSKKLSKFAIVVHILALLVLYVIIYEVAFPTPNALENMIQISLRVSLFVFMFASLFYYSFIS